MADICILPMRKDAAFRNCGWGGVMYILLMLARDQDSVIILEANLHFVHPIVTIVVPFAYHLP